MKWVVFRNSELKEFSLKYLLWGHGEIFPLFTKIISQKTDQKRSFYQGIYYGAVITFCYVLIACVLLMFIKVYYYVDVHRL